MPVRKHRLPVVLDTNVIIGNYLSRSATSPNRQIFELWRDCRELQLIVGSVLVEEYLEILERIGVSSHLVERFKARLQQ